MKKLSPKIITLLSVGITCAIVTIIVLYILDKRAAAAAAASLAIGTRFALAKLNNAGDTKITQINTNLPATPPSELPDDSDEARRKRIDELGD